MKVLELFAGSRSLGKEAVKMGHTVFSVDITAYENIDWVGDILDFTPKDCPFTPDIIWASPPCEGFSVAAIGHHWTGGKGAYIPKTDRSRLGIKLLDKTLELIKSMKPKYWYIENPRGLMRKMPQMEGINRHTVTYCQYGDTRMKPTDIWTNNITWSPKPMCKKGSPCHESAPRGSRTGTQGLNGAHERSKIPALFCEEILLNSPVYRQ